MQYEKNHGRNSNFHWIIIWSLEIALLPLSSTVSQAASYYWSASSDDWSTATNWGGTVPTSSDWAYIQNGGTVTINQAGEQCSYLYLGATDTGSVEMTDGSLSVWNSSYIGDSGTGMFTQSGGTNTISSYLSLGSDSSSSGIYYLNGGTLILKSLGQGSGTAAFNFGGGTLQASGAFTCSLPMTLTGDGGDANIDTAGYTVTLSGVLSGSGGLDKLGSGTLMLSGKEAYAGNTTVTGGTLIFSGGIASSGTSLIDAESGTAILKTTNVTKSDLNIFTSSSATFEATDGTPAVGSKIMVGYIDGHYGSLPVFKGELPASGEITIKNLAKGESVAAMIFCS
jgi:autotransporter-associated beta strand protein